MNEPLTSTEKMLTIDKKLFSEFSSNLFVGVGMFFVYSALIACIVVGIGALSFWLIPKISGAFTIAAFILIGFMLCFAWYISYFISLEFLTRVGIKLSGRACYAVIPIALILGFLSFLLEFLSTIGSGLKNSRARTFVLLCVIIAIGALTFAALK